MNSCESEYLKAFLPLFAFPFLRGRDILRKNVAEKVMSGIKNQVVLIWVRGQHNHKSSHIKILYN